MTSRYLIVGGGMTADAAVRGIRELDTAASIGLIGDDPDPPYSRPPLTKALWKGEPFESVWRKTGDLGVELHLGSRRKPSISGARRWSDDRGTPTRSTSCCSRRGESRDVSRSAATT
jgi:hypothetical protein